MTVPRNTILHGDATEILSQLPTSAIDLALTSPPYFQLRDYGVAGQLGHEPHVDGWVEQLRAVARELHRVLTPWGSLWLNVGDSYSAHARFGAPPKSLLLAPERLAQALIADGWILRNKVVWAKPNPLPSPAKDRLTTAYELVYFFVKQSSYYFDLDAIRAPLVSRRRPSRGSRTPASALGKLAGSRDGLVAMARRGVSGHPLGKNPSDVWTIASSHYRGAHFATFPPELARRPIRAGSPLNVCLSCERPWRRSLRRVTFLDGSPQARPFVPCGCGAPTRRGLVCDPFAGSGTTGLVAADEDRDFIGIELNKSYIELAEARLGERLDGGRKALLSAHRDNHPPKEVGP